MIVGVKMTRKEALVFLAHIILLAGSFFLALGVIGLLFATHDHLARDQPTIATGVVIASSESPSTNQYTVRVKLSDGPEVALEQPSPIAPGSRLRVVLRDGSYSIYDPLGPWLGSSLSLASGIMLRVAARWMKNSTHGHVDEEP